MSTTQTGLRIQARRGDLGSSQRTLAEIADVSLHTLSDLETGKGNPTLATLSRMLSPLGLELRIDVRKTTLWDPPASRPITSFM